MSASLVETRLSAIRRARVRCTAYQLALLASPAAAALSDVVIERHD